MARTIQDLFTKAQASNWKTFVAEFVRLSTRTREGATCASDYRVVKRGNKYEITFGGLKPYSPMDAETLYGWMQRLPLKYFADQADEYRWRVMTSN